MILFVSAPEDPGGPLLSPTDFEAALIKRWPEARIEHPHHPDDPRAIEWQVPMSHSVVVGSFARDGETVVCDGDVHDCAEVAHWFRGLVPAAQPLLFYDQDYSRSVELRADTAINDLVRSFLA